MRNMKVNCPVNGTSALKARGVQPRKTTPVISFPGAGSSSKCPSSIYAKSQPKVKAPSVRSVQPLQLVYAESPAWHGVKEDVLCAGHPASRSCASEDMACRAMEQQGWRDALGFDEMKHSLVHGSSRGIALNVATRAQAVIGGVILSGVALSMVLLSL